MMTLTPEEARAKVTVGWWYARCCIEDIYQFRTDAEVVDVLDDYAEDAEEGHSWAGFWPTKEEALLALSA